jgi:hypothetical protein
VALSLWVATAVATAGPPAGATAGAGSPGGGSPRLAAARSAEAAYEARCSLHLSFHQLEQAAAHPDGGCVHLEGQVFQYTPGHRSRTMLVDVTDTGGGIWDTTIEVRVPGAPGGRAITDDDVVEIWGPVAGTADARVRFGGHVHVPLVDARYVALRHAIASTITTPAPT